MGFDFGLAHQRQRRLRANHKPELSEWQVEQRCGFRWAICQSHARCEWTIANHYQPLSGRNGTVGTAVDDVFV